jgi:hypothetical protein
VGSETKVVGDLGDWLGFVATLLSAVVALYAARIARSAVRSQQNVEKWRVNLDFFARAEEMFLKNPNLVGFHGVDAVQLAADGVTAEEFLYLLYQFDAGDSFYNIGQEDEVTLTSYRRNLLQHPKVRLVWKKYLRHRLFNPTPFVHAVDRYVDEIERGTGA